ncbi:sugar transferase [Segnochrobactrum spirostomi]|uniref:Sugar transferase n=1 Tax=Segnochrobactrum spirostomi TaxID=2608987 RepID=A0A6A7Y696_9HYPH|nr:sugar transferase [Segnochrobactrum spirostomi]MQT14316.1 sugar transferase [Segnochrobactrum spirostomi]
MKRLLDIVFSITGLVVGVPVMLVCAVLIRLDSPGNPLFAQIRVGRNGRLFVCYKLRTMRAGTPNVATHEASRASVTRIGQVLRKTKLDELPQLWNVLVGEMSLVGPRPCLPSQVALIEARRARGVLALRPGITGIAQVAGVDMSDPERLAVLDARYVGDHSLVTYFTLLFRTVFGAGRGDRVAS